jgi:hypothetical protein
VLKGIKDIKVQQAQELKVVQDSKVLRGTMGLKVAKVK